MKMMITLLVLLLPLQQTKQPEKPNPVYVGTMCATTADCLSVSSSGYIVPVIQMPEPEVLWKSAIVKDHRKTYSLDVRDDWTCVPFSNAKQHGYDHEDVSLVTITCVKAYSK